MQLEAGFVQQEMRQDSMERQLNRLELRLNHLEGLLSLIRSQVLDNYGSLEEVKTILREEEALLKEPLPLFS